LFHHRAVLEAGAPGAMRGCGASCGGPPAGGISAFAASAFIQFRRDKPTLPEYCGAGW